MHFTTQLMALSVHHFSHYKTVLAELLRQSDIHQYNSEISINSAERGRWQKKMTAT
jgi:hypothetical protein